MWTNLGLLAPLHILGIQVFLWDLIGPYSLIALAVQVVSFPINGWLAKRLTKGR